MAFSKRLRWGTGLSRVFGITLALGILPRAGGTEFSWVPIGSDGPFVLSGADAVGEPTTILLEPGITHRVEFEIRANGWLNAPGTPTVGTAQATLDAAGLLGVNADPSTPGVDLAPIFGPHGGFDAAFITLRTCHTFVDPDLVSTGQRCDVLVPPLPSCPPEAPICIDNPEFIFSGILQAAAASTSNPNYAWGAVSQAGLCRADEVGRSFYIGTFIFDVPASASSTYTFGFDSGLSATLLNNCAAARISGLIRTPGHLGFDCNGNTIPDNCDISCGLVGGSCDVPDCGGSNDCNDNGRPDECEIDANAMVDCSSTPPPCDEGPFYCTANCAADANVNGIPDVCDGPSVEVLRWESSVSHGIVVGFVRLEIPEDGSYTEPRTGGISRLLVTYTGAVDTSGASASVAAACDATGTPVDLSGTTIAVTQGAADRAVITFNPKLPGSDTTAHVPAIYQILLTGVTDDNGVPVADTERVLRAVLGDAFGNPLGTGDGRVSAADNGLVRSLAAAGINPIDPNEATQVRSDAFTDGKITAADNGLVRSLAAEGLTGQGLSLVCP